MDHRSPARFLAPLALVGVILALFLVLKPSSGRDSSSARSTSTSSTGPRRGPRAKPPAKPTAKAATYRVKPGDTLQGIAAKTRVSLEVLRELNPAINPQALVVGQIIKLKG
jgi:LysM repeat protein